MPNPPLTAIPSANEASAQPVSVVTLSFAQLAEADIDIKPQPHARVKIRVSDSISAAGKRQHVYVVEASATRDGAWRHHDHASESEIIDFRTYKRDWVMTIIAVEIQDSDVVGKVAVRKSKLTIPPSTDVEGDDFE